MLDHPDSTTKKTRPRYGWLAALLILALALATEMLPIVGGTGEDARLDWSFIYVTMHFVLLPLACAAHIAWNTGVLAFARARVLRERLKTAVSMLIPVAYLALLWARPVFPLWGAVLWNRLRETGQLL